MHGRFGGPALLIFEVALLPSYAQHLLNNVLTQGLSWMLPSQGMPNLTVLILRNVAEVWGLQRCTNLKALQLDRCYDLRILDLEGLIALQQLYIRWCLNLHKINLTGLTSLRSLTGWRCNSLAQIAGLEDLGTIDQVRTRISTKHVGNHTASRSQPLNRR
jgi:hypothetical protein